MPYLPDLDSICSRIPSLRSLLVELDPTRPRLRSTITIGQLAWYAAACALWVGVYLSTRGQPFVFRVAAGFAVIALVVVGSYFRRRAGFRKGLNKVRQAMLDASLCPSCTHALEGLPRHDDGCVVCPECGAAWNACNDATSHPPVA